MSQSQYAVELCALLVQETYGELASRIFTILLRRGRLPVSALSRHTRLTPKKVRHGLVVLVQQNLIYHATDQDTNQTYYDANYDAAYALVRSGRFMEHVESKHSVLAREIVQNLLLLGHATISDLIESYEAQKAEQSRLAVLAREEKHKAEKLERERAGAEEMDTGESNGKTNGVEHMEGYHVNGHPFRAVATLGQIHTVLVRLFEDGLIERVNNNMFRSPADIKDELEKDLVRKNYGGSVKTGKQKEELTAQLNYKLRELRDSGSEWRPDPCRSKKRPHGEANGTNGTSKRRRLSHGAVNGEHEYGGAGLRLEDDLVIRVNYEKFTVVLRNKQIVEFAKHKIGKTTSQVLEQLLKLCEPSILRCAQDPDPNKQANPPSMSVEEIADTLEKEIDPGFGIGKTDSTRHDKSKPEKPRRNSTAAPDAGAVKGINGRSKGANGVSGKSNGHVDGAEAESEEAESDADNDPFAPSPVKEPKRHKVTFQEDSTPKSNLEYRANRIRQVKNHMELLLHDECPFVFKSGMEKGGKYSVDFEQIVNHMRAAEMDQLLFEAFGAHGHRLIRIMKKVGKLDEKTLEKKALLASKDLRTKVAELQQAGIVDIQEVPKDATRNTNMNNTRTVFLWFYDSERVDRVMVDKIYKAMTRLIQRLVYERQGAKTVLDTTERSDVRHLEPQAFLEDYQLKSLQDIERKEAMLMGQVGRLDDLIGIFRDF